MKRTSGGWLALTLVCLLLPACGGSEPAAPAGDAAGEPTGASTAPAATAAEAGGGEEGEGGEGEGMAASGSPAPGAYDGEEAPEEDENVPTDEEDDDG